MSSYRIGRIVSYVGIGLGWIVGIAGIVAGLMMTPPNGFIPAFAFISALVNHGLWQMVLALFDIADHTRETAEKAELTAAYLKQLVAVGKAKPG